YFKVVLTGGHFELVFVMEGRLLECFHFFLTVEVEVHRIAEARSDCAIRFVCDPQHVDRGVLLPLHLYERYRLPGNVDRQVDPRCVRRSVEERSPHRAGNISREFTGGVTLQILLDGVSGQKIPGPNVAVAAARPHNSPAAVYLDAQRVTAALQ